MSRLLTGKAVEVVLVVVLFQSSETSAAVVLRTATALLITEVLSSIRSEEADVLRILAASLHLGVVVWTRERLLLAGKLRTWAIGGEVQLGAVVRSLQHDRAVAELLDQTVLALDGF